jgi:uncharacterized Zn finger protein (UPF0148 family)
VNQYRLKNCKNCGAPFRKQGDYCSRSCGNRRVHSEEDKLKRSIKLKEFYNTPEGVSIVKTNHRRKAKKIAEKQAMENGEYVLKPDDYAVQIPNFDDDDDKIIW